MNSPLILLFIVDKANFETVDRQDLLQSSRLLPGGFSKAEHTPSIRQWFWSSMVFITSVPAGPLSIETVSSTHDSVHIAEQRSLFSLLLRVQYDDHEWTLPGEKL